MAIPASFENLSVQVGQRLMEAGLMLVTAESCTGGWVAQTITTIPGSSKWFERGFVTYSNRAKHEMLGVPEEIIARYGAVSDQTIRAMAAGALKYSHGDIAVAISGIAGPAGGSKDRPVGTVFFAWVRQGRKVWSERYQFQGDRLSIRRQAVETALDGVLTTLDGRSDRP